MPHLERLADCLRRLPLVVVAGAFTSCAEQNALPPEVISAMATNRHGPEFKGQYLCDQGTTGMTLQIVGGQSPDQTYAIFHFAPVLSNPNVASGSFILEGQFDPGRGTINMAPMAWITRPLGYMAVGLNGASTDGGKTYEGQLTGVSGLLSGCSTFEIERTT